MKNKRLITASPLWATALWTLLISWIALMPLAVSSQAVDVENKANAYPELGEIRDMIRMKKPDGVAFVVMDHDTEAYSWVLPRLEHYIEILRQKWPDLPISLLSHGDEIFSLLADREEDYKAFHDRIRHLVREQDVQFQVCGAFASFSGVDESEFADFVEVVPSAPVQLSDYRMLGYKIVHLELIW